MSTLPASTFLFMLTAQPKYRIASIDILRGLVMLIMALDHIRDFFHQTAMLQDPLDLQTTTPALFFTRWITHFCAPVFVFLSGTSAYLSGLQKSKRNLSNFLIKRGLWLLLVEMVVITFGLTFNPHYNLIIWQVIWAIGWSMILLGLLTRLPLAAIATIGFVIVVGHNITDYVSLSNKGVSGTFLQVLLTTSGAFLPVSKDHAFLDAYAILPWTGIMLLGYALGYYFRKEVEPLQRRKVLLGLGFSTIFLFIALRYLNLYGDPRPWVAQRNSLYTFLSFINTAKYPPSLLYTCMTIGPALLLLAFFEPVKNNATAVVSVYGRVPFFYYILHFYVIHILLVVLFFASGYSSSQISDGQIPFWFRPVGFGYSLPVIYGIWLAVIASLYLPCRWYDRYKQTHRQWWLSYL